MMGNSLGGAVSMRMPVFPGTGHMPHLERPAEFAALARENAESPDAMRPGSGTRRSTGARGCPRTR